MDRDEAAVEALRALIRIPTVSDWDRDKEDRAAFEALLVELRERFPRLHEACDLQRIAGDALLVRWAGRSAEQPVVLMAHVDVVPVGDESAWTHPPFAAEVADGQVWGRGALDCKGSLVATCAAVESLLEDGATPDRDVWLSFGCTEEVSGGAAKEAVRHLRERAVEPWFVIDEGGAIVEGVLPGVVAPMGVIGVAEKGTAVIELTARGDGGHASAPRKMGATARLARAILRLEKKPFPSHLPDATVEMLERVGAHARMPYAAVFGNAARLRPVLSRVLPRLGHETAAMARTTVAVTQLTGSPAANVIAATARALVNVRVMVGETVDGAIERIRRTIGDPHVEVALVSGDEPSPVSPTDDTAYALLTATLEEVFPGTVPVPYVMLAATDSRHFHRVWPRVYRFTPFRMTDAQRASIHGVDERIGVDDFLDGVSWYRRLIEQL
ncbi:M20/M25/M40 family metallo-hydrolase [Terrabacter sp. MAHUQ-38]|uniref:M20/M25/M40 family metallo-hydrolase n=1 Tax=unclassified Terrabacter TaxID=2630222 RepID=UPI00165E2B73|nr:M20/M25/M40 family metallo-hydrolase [Terrabacter sp. MAHUQ-38]MBC9820707.1 M20/M25/M40 family metallo-hydrolase [Terrabacter sp. MAHUQ-38]